MTVKNTFKPVKLPNEVKKVKKEPIITKAQKEAIRRFEALPYKRVHFVINHIFDTFPDTVQEIIKARGW